VKKSVNWPKNNSCFETR